MPSIPSHQLLSLFWPPRSCLIIREFSRWQCLPYIEHGINHRPAGFDHVGALEERGVPDHAIVEQHFIAGLGGAAEIILVVEAHVHRTDLHQRTGNFGAELELDSL